MRRSVASRLHPDSLVSRTIVSAYGIRHGIAVGFRDGHISFRHGRREIRIAVRDFPYSRDMIRSFDSYHGSVQADADGVVDFSRPAVHRYAGSGLEFSLPSIAEEEDALDGYFLWYTPAPGDLVFDIGAHAGVSTHLLSKAVGPEGRVYAFEPDPVSLPHLRRNIDAHGLRNVTIVPMAIAAQSGRLAFYSEGSLGSTLVDVASRPGTSGAIEVDAITLADACAMAGSAPAYIKMDIEGAELGVIGSSRGMIAAARIQFSVDTNHTVEGSLTNARLERLFAEAGYDAMSSAEYGFMTTWARPRDARSE